MMQGGKHEDLASGGLRLCPEDTGFRDHFPQFILQVPQSEASVSLSILLAHQPIKFSSERYLTQKTL
jgi:hypothetical protein